MADPFSYLDSLSEDDLRRRLAAVQSERQKRAADRQTYQTIRDAQDTGSSPEAAVQNQGKIAVDQALQGASVPDYVQALNKQVATPSQGEVDRFRQLGQATGATSPAAPGEDLSPDIEAAKAKPGAIERVSGDQRLVVDADGNAVATRSEFPTVPQHLDALVHGESGDASFIGTMGNVLEGLARPEATAFNYAQAAMAGRHPDVTNLPEDLASSVIGGSGASGNVSEGGMVAKRGGGWGDVLRARMKDMVDQVGSPDGTPHPVAGVLAPLWASSAALAMAAPVAGAAAPLAMLYAGSKAKEAVSASEPQRDATLGDLVASIGLPPEVFDAAITPLSNLKEAALMADAKLTGVDMGFLVPDRPAEAAKNMSDMFGMQRKLKDISPEDPAIDAYGQVASMMFDPLNAIPVEKGPEALFSAAEKLGIPGAGMARAAVTKDLTKMFSRESALQGQIAKDAVRAGAPADAAAADAKKMAEGVYGEAQRVHAESQLENNAQQQLLEQARAATNKEDSPLVRQLLEGPADVRLRDQPDVVQLDNIRRAAEAINYSGLSTSEEAMVRAIPQNIIANPAALAQVPREVLFRRQRLADKLGVDLTVAHPWAQSRDIAQQRALGGARQLRKALARNLEEDQLRSLLPSHLRPEGFFPHAPRANLAVKMEAAGVPRPIAGAVERVADPFLNRLGYDPRRPREMAALGDVEVLRRASNVVVQDAQRAGRPVSPNLAAFALKPKLAENKAWVEAVRKELLQAHNVQVWAPTGTVEEAQRLAANRMATGRGRNVTTPVNFEQDPARAVAAYRNAAAPAQQGVAFGEAIKGLRDTRGMPVAEPLLDAVVNPRHGVPDPLLLHKMRTDPRGPLGALFEGDALISDAHRYLEQKGLHYISKAEVRATPALAPLAKHVVPRAIYQDLVTVAPRLRAGVLEKAANLMAKSVNFWAPVVLNTPGFHIRNAIFGQFQVYLALGADIADPALWHAAGVVASAAEKGGLAPGVIRYLGRDWKIADLAEEARRMGVFEGGRMADMEGAIKRGLMPYNNENAADLLRRVNPFSQRGLVTKEPLAKLAVSRGIGGALSLGGGAATAENVQRMMIYLHRRMNQGVAARAAAQDVVKYMFDYTGAHLSPSEKMVRRFAPFYQWIKQSLLLTLDQMTKNPKRYAQVDHLFKTAAAFTGAGTNQDPRLTPAFIGDQGGIPAPFASSSPDQRTWLSTERPGTQASWLMEPLLRGDLSGVGQGVAQQLGPLPSMATEVMRGKYNFGNRELDPDYAPEMSAPGTATGAAERLMGMQAHLMPEYFMRKGIGGYPGLATDASLNLVDPELTGNNPRFTGLDEANRRVTRAISMLFGPRVTQTNPSAVAEQERKRLGTVIDKVHDQRVDRAKRRLGQ